MLPKFQHFLRERAIFVACGAFDAAVVLVALVVAAEVTPLALLLLVLVAVAVAVQVGALRALKLRRERRALAEDRVTAIFRRTMDQRKSAIRDESTGLVYRWYLDMRLEQEGARCRRYGLQMAVVVLRAGLVSIVDWQSDDWRDAATDAGARAANVVRNVDLSANIGPLEYAFCLVHCDHEGALRAVERIAGELSGYNCEAGLAIYPDDNCPPASLIELARGRVRSVEALLFRPPAAV